MWPKTKNLRKYFEKLVALVVTQIFLVTSLLYPAPVYPVRENHTEGSGCLSAYKSKSYQKTLSMHTVRDYKFSNGVNSLNQKADSHLAPPLFLGKQGTMRRGNNGRLGVVNPFRTKVLSETREAIEAERIHADTAGALLQTQNIHKAEVPVKVNGEEWNLFVVRCQDNNWRGPFKGGIRFIFAGDDPLGRELNERLEALSKRQHTQEELQALGEDLEEWVTQEGQAMSKDMTWKVALADLPYGGGKAQILGVLVRRDGEERVTEIKPLKQRELSRDDRRNMMRAIGADWARAGIIGYNIDIPAPDVNTTGEDMAWLMDGALEVQAERLGLKLIKQDYEHPLNVPYLSAALRLKKREVGTFTGKPSDLGGLAVRTIATGLGASYVISRALEEPKIRSKMKNPSEPTEAITGFGNAGRFGALEEIKRGRRIVAINDTGGAVLKEEGFSENDIKILIEAKENKQSVVDAADKVGARAIRGKEDGDRAVLEADVDILLLASVEDVIHTDPERPGYVRRVKALLITEAANGPITREADQELFKRGVSVLPDILASAGGVIVSYWEWWLNDPANKRMSDDEIAKDVYMRMRLNFTEMWSLVKSENISLRKAATRIAIRRVVDAKQAAKQPELVMQWKSRPVWFFDDKVTADEKEPTRDLLGGKGGGLREMTQAGLPVPPGYTITTEVCNTYLAQGVSDDELLRLNKESMAKLEKKEETGKKFGDQTNPLLVSVRSGAKFSMPGMMDTVLNVGLNDETVEGLAKLTNDPRFAYDAYRRLIQMFGKVVMDVDGDLFEQAIAEKKKQRNVKDDTGLSAEDWKALADEFKTIIKSQTNREFPQDPYMQLHLATQAVFKSWLGDRAREYRKIRNIPEDLGTAVNVVTMVFGNMGTDSGTGVAFTRDPATGEKKFYGDFLINAQGEDVVAGIRNTMPISEMERVLPDVYKQLLEVAELLEKIYGDVQDIEFTIENGKLWMLQTRRGQRTPQAALRIAMDMHNEGLIDAEEAIMRVSPEQLEILLHPMFDSKAVEEAKKIGRFLTKGTDASPGAAFGRIALSAERAKEMAKEGPVILVRPETNPNDVGGINASKGVLTHTGGKTSHAAVVTRGFGIPCVVGAADIEIDEEKREIYVSGKTLKEGDWISIDGGTGEIFEGQIATVASPIIQYALATDQEQARKESPLYAAYQDLMTLADKHTRLGSWANADNKKDATIARALGAKGIGLARTEHMFLGERLPGVQRMLLGSLVKDDKLRDSAIGEILPLQRQDFIDLFEAMDTLPVIIRLLDPPLHEFLPKLRDENRIKELIKETGRTGEEIRQILKDISEENPMFGYRGVRLLLHFPEIAKMQIRAIIEAAIEAQKRDIEVHPEIMVPVVSEQEEFVRMRDIIQEVAEAVMKEKGVNVDYKIGTMIEIARAPLLADRIIADGAEFFSFGTNDLTQSGLGASRDDVAKFIPLYVERGIYPVDPFKTVDHPSVGALIALTKMLDSKGIEVGICGEHGGDPVTIDLLHNAGLTYASASPFRVPITRLSAAQAAIRERRGEKDKKVLASIETARRLKKEVIPQVRAGKAISPARSVTPRASVTRKEELTALAFSGVKAVDLDLTQIILQNPEVLLPLRRAILIGMVADNNKIVDSALNEFKKALERKLSDITGDISLERISVSLLDIPLMALVTVSEEELEGLARALEISPEDLARRITLFKEANPMIGERGARLLISRGEKLFEAQLVAAFEAVKGFAGRPVLQINVPYVSEIKELEIVRALVERIAKKQESNYKLGIILETPKAAMIAGELVNTGLVDALVFDLLDLTQTTWGMGREDAEDFLRAYLAQGIIDANPFELLDKQGLLVFIADAIRQARLVKSDIPIEITGPQLADKASTDVLARMGIDGFIVEPALTTSLEVDALAELSAFSEMVKLGKQWLKALIPYEGFVMEDGTRVTRITDVSELPEEARKHWNNHVGIVVLENAKLGYTAYIGIHHLLPYEGRFRCIGGTRNLQYGSVEDALIDALILPSAMSNKAVYLGNGIPIGGGKVIINSDPKVDINERKAVYESVGRVLESLNIIFTGQDMNTTLELALHMSKFAPNSILGHPDMALGGKESTPSTAEGLVEGMKRMLQAIEGDVATLKNRNVSILGIGGVGSNLVRLLVDREKILEPNGDNILYVTDISEERRSWVRKEYKDLVEAGRIIIFDNPDDIFDAPAEIFSPNAKESDLNSRTIPRLQKAGVKYVAGAENEQLETPEDAVRLYNAGIVYLVDYVINAGGMAAVISEALNLNMAEVIKGIGEAVYYLVKQAKEKNVPAPQIADAEAAHRLRAFDIQLLEKANTSLLNELQATAGRAGFASVGHTAPLRKPVVREGVFRTNMAEGRLELVFEGGSVKVSHKFTESPRSVYTPDELKRIEANLIGALATWQAYLDSYGRNSLYAAERFSDRDSRSFKTSFFVDPDNEFYISNPGDGLLEIDDEWRMLPAILQTLLLNHEANFTESVALDEDLLLYAWMKKNRKEELEAALKAHPELMRQPYFAFLEKNWDKSEEDRKRAIVRFMMQEELRQAGRSIEKGNFETAGRILDKLRDIFVALCFSQGKAGEDFYFVPDLMAPLVHLLQSKELPNLEKLLGELRSLIGKDDFRESISKIWSLMCNRKQKEAAEILANHKKALNEVLLPLYNLRHYKREQIEQREIKTQFSAGVIYYAIDNRYFRNRRFYISLGSIDGINFFLCWPAALGEAISLVKANDLVYQMEEGQVRILGRLITDEDALNKEKRFKDISPRLANLIDNAEPQVGGVFHSLYYVSGLNAMAASRTSTGHGHPAPVSISSSVKSSQFRMFTGTGPDMLISKVTVSEVIEAIDEMRQQLIRTRTEISWKGIEWQEPDGKFYRIELPLDFQEDNWNTALQTLQKRLEQYPPTTEVEIFWNHSHGVISVTIMPAEGPTASVITLPLTNGEERDVYYTAYAIRLILGKTMEDIGDDASVQVGLDGPSFTSIDEVIGYLEGQLSGARVPLSIKRSGSNIIVILSASIEQAVSEESARLDRGTPPRGLRAANRFYQIFHDQKTFKVRDLVDITEFGEFDYDTVLKEVKQLQKLGVFRMVNPARGNIGADYILDGMLRVLAELKPGKFEEVTSLTLLGKASLTPKNIASLREQIEAILIESFKDIDPYLTYDFLQEFDNPDVFRTTISTMEEGVVVIPAELIGDSLGFKISLRNLKEMASGKVSVVIDASDVYDIKGFLELTNLRMKDDKYGYEVAKNKDELRERVLAKARHRRNITAAGRQGYFKDWLADKDIKKLIVEPIPQDEVGTFANLGVVSAAGGLAIGIKLKNVEDSDSPNIYILGRSQVPGAVTEQILAYKEILGAK